MYPYIERTAQDYFPPAHSQIVIVFRPDGKRGQCQIADGVAYLWRYGITTEEFCKVDDIVKWRGCHGLDF